uniref:Uncharacterized protein n=1 Tax=Strix occidentalis caurina TaxID=311401 RepID=A0A8D0FZY0_STROC
EFHHHDDQTPLHISARLGKADIVQQLLQQGASPNAATTSGYTPLHLSAREGHEDVASVLLDHGLHFVERVQNFMLLPQSLMCNISQ